MATWAHLRHRMAMAEWWARHAELGAETAGRSKMRWYMCKICIWSIVLWRASGVWWWREAGPSRLRRSWAGRWRSWWRRWCCILYNWTFENWGEKGRICVRQSDNLRGGRFRQIRVTRADKYWLIQILIRFLIERIPTSAIRLRRRIRRISTGWYTYLRCAGARRWDPLELAPRWRTLPRHSIRKYWYRSAERVPLVIGHRCAWTTFPSGSRVLQRRW